MTEKLKRPEQDPEDSLVLWGYIEALETELKNCENISKGHVAYNTDLQKQVSKLQEENELLKEAIFKLIPGTFHGDKEALKDDPFAEAFKNMVVKAYLQELTQES